MIYTVIMAGGKGTRFWPVSRSGKPKQLLSIAEKKTMIQATVERISPLAPADRTIIVTGAEHAAEIARQLPDIPAQNIIVEPAGRNTAPCVALAAHIIEKRSPGAVMAVFPADHVVTGKEKLIETIRELAHALEDNPEKLATIGISPSYPETGYGYIKLGKSLSGAVSHVDSFKEKPDLATAEEYLKAGGYLWNSGMFFWKTGAILASIEKHAPELSKAMAPLAETVDTAGFGKAMENLYPSMPSISVDHAIMEKAAADGMALVADADPGWSDVGSWRSLYDLNPADEKGNRANGELVAVDSTGLLVHNENRLVAAVGVSDLIIVETEDAILVCHKDKAQDLRHVIEDLKRRGLERLL